MSTHPYLPLYVDDYEAATAHLTAEEDGVYSRLMRLCWRTPGCSLPNDPAWVARKIRLSAADYERIAQPVIEEFFKVQRGRLIQKRLKDEYDTISRKKSARVKAGKKGGEAKALKTKEIEPSNASDLPADMRAFPEPEPEPIEDTPLPPEGATRRKPKRPIPDGFPAQPLIDEQQAKARSVGANIDIANQAERFRNWSISKDSRYADWPATWRNWCDRAIKDAPKTPMAALAARPASSDDDRWRRWLREFRQNRHWPTDDAGPRPGHPACRVPPALLAEFGFAPSAANDPDLFAQGDAA